MKAVKTILWILYQPYKWLVFVPFLGLSAAFFSMMGVLMAELISPRAGSMICGYLWSRICSALTPISVKVIGRENIQKGQSYIVVSNHQSHYDIFVLYGWLLLDIKWVMKQELRKVPFIGWACEKFQFIYIDRSDNQKAIESLNAARERIVNGTCAVFFPEGTRSKDGKIAAFKKGAFRMAIDLGLPLLPITMNGTRKVLPSGSFDLMPGKVNMIIHPPVSTTGLVENDLSSLIDKTKNVILKDFQPSP